MEKGEVSTQLMDHVNDYIMTQNLIPAQVCKSLIRESSLPERKWSKHSWYNYGRDDFHSKKEKELDIINSKKINNRKEII